MASRRWYRPEDGLSLGCSRPAPGVYFRKPLGPFDGLVSQRHVDSAVNALALRVVVLTTESAAVIAIDPLVVVGEMECQPQFEAGI